MAHASTSAIVSSEWSPLRTAKKASSAIVSPIYQSSDATEHPSLQSPKQVTQNFKALRTHGLVSNSIFKQTDSPTPTSPLAITPKKRIDGLPSHGQDENTSPAERKVPRKSLGRLHESHCVSTSVFLPSPTSKGLLTSNRLHGPRYMDAGAAASPERRKTVTFDEILDVQEFEHEVSFDAPVLAVVNAGDEPELDASRDEDSRSSAEGPPSPEHEPRLSAAERVDSMMDELLSQDILNSPSLRAQPDVEPEPLALPLLPAWTPLDLSVDVKPAEPVEPLSFDVTRSQTQPHIAPTPEAAPARARPHISRDAILQRVAREKAKDTPPRTPRGSEPARRPTASTPPPPVPCEYKPAPAPSPVKHALEHTPVQSPLESLGTELQHAYPLDDAPRGPRRKRSLSDTAPAPRAAPRKSIGTELAQSKEALDASLQRAMDGGFQHTLEQELSKIYTKDELPYHVQDRGAFEGVGDKVTHSATAGDVDAGKAWKKLRRPSDMHEYKQELRALHDAHHSQARPLPGKVFVLVDSFTPADLPVPARPTHFHCILDNGLHMVKTATVPLRRGGVSAIGQEFELIQHRNLEFSLTLVAQRDAHLVEPRPASPTRSPSPTLKGLSRFFSSPKKHALKRDPPAALPAEPMLAYMNREGAFGRTGVVFERVAAQCFAKCLVLDLPVHGASNPAVSVAGPSSLASRAPRDDFRANLGKVRGTLRLKLFYLPPLPTVPRNRLPENLADCVRGMEDAAWHRAAPWLSGTLTQLGGDCASWRRRPTTAQGQFLICSSTVTKKPTVKIDLGKAVCVEEVGNEVGGLASSRGSVLTLTRTRTAASALLADDEDADANYHVDRSFRITFADGERIQFFADSEEEKAQWVQVVTDVVDNGVPPNPLWAQAVLTLHAEPPPPKQRVTTVAEEDEAPTPRHQRTQSAIVSPSSPAVPRLPPPVLSTRTSSTLLASPRRTPASEIRATPNTPANRAAFDRLKRAAGHTRSRTEDLTASRRFA